MSTIIIIIIIVIIFIIILGIFSCISTNFAQVMFWKILKLMSFSDPNTADLFQISLITERAVILQSKLSRF